ncbi:MAG: flagellar biosynthetic protein FliR [Legionellaceae bacterium]|nr:flagellar biosynthetic protein FliR [Legionellaceae bacterium]
MNLDYASAIHSVSQFLWPLARISGLFLTLPIVSSVMLPRRIRVIFVMSLAMVCAPTVSEQWSLLHFQTSYVGIVAQELLLGILMGFIIQLVFQAFILAGQIIAMQAGLGFASMIDPSSRASVPLVGQFYLILVSLMFLTLNGHLAVFEALLTSFKTMPIGELQVDMVWLSEVILFSGWMFKEAVLVALPTICSLLIASMSFGIMAKVAPQLNIFSLGFPITLLSGIILLRLTLYGVSDQISDSVAAGMQLINAMVR